jgi:serine phosphatase RsbU (regulator of sigma subunit)
LATSEQAPAKTPGKRGTTALTMPPEGLPKAGKPNRKRPSPWNTILLAVAFSIPSFLFLDPPPSWQTLVALAYYSFLISLIWRQDRRRLTELMSKLMDTLEFVHQPSKLPPALTIPHASLADAVTDLNIHLKNLHQRFRSTAHKANLDGQKEIAIAIQADLQPGKPPEVPGLHIALWQHKGPGIGGDFYDFITKPEPHTGEPPNEFMFAIADVKGKAVKAGLLLALTRSTIRNKTKYFSSPGRIITRVNDDLSRDMALSDIFVSLFVGIYRPSDRALYYGNADFPPPILRRSDGSVFQLKTEDFILGTVQGQEYEERMLQLAPGDVVVAYSNGVQDARNPQKEKIGFERLVEIIRSNGDLPADDLVDYLKNLLADWHQGQESLEDQTIIVLRSV